MFALDTNTLIFYFKGIGRVSHHLLQTPPRDIALPAVVLYELEVGIRRLDQPNKRRQQLAEFLRLITILPFDAKAALAAAEVRTTLERQGQGIGPLDTLIAGTAIGHGAILVTHNSGEFTRVQGLRCVDWFD